MHSKMAIACLREVPSKSGQMSCFLEQCIPVQAVNRVPSGYRDLWSAKVLFQSVLISNS